MTLSGSVVVGQSGLMGVTGIGIRLAAVLLAASLCGCSAGAPVTGRSTLGSPPEGSTSTTSRPAPPKPPPSLAAAMREWEAIAGDHFKKSATALGRVSDAAAAGDDSAVRGACEDLHDTNAIGLQGHLPTPDPALTAELQRMIDDVNIATHACLRFADGHRPTDADTYQEYLARAVEHLHRAKGILAADLRGR